MAWTGGPPEKQKLALTIYSHVSRLRFCYTIGRSKSMPSINLYVGNLPYSLSESDLAELFAPFGEVLSAKIITDRYSGQSKGFGFVEMSSRSEGEESIAALNGKELNRRQIKVNEAKPRSDNRRRGGGFGGHRGGGRF